MYHGVISPKTMIKSSAIGIKFVMKTLHSLLFDRHMEIQVNAIQLKLKLKLK